MASELLQILAPTFLCALVGYVWVRSGRAFDREVIGELITTVGAPCLVFSSLASIEISAAAMAEMAIAALVGFGLFALLAALALELLGLPRRSFLAPLTFGNQGNMGIPLCLFAFGEEGQALGLVYFTIAASLQFSVGLFMWSGHFDPMELVRNPIGLAALLAVGVLLADLPLPRFVLDTTHLLGSLAIPLMLLALGSAMADLRVTAVPRTLLLSLVRLAIGLVVGFGLAWALDFDGVARGVLILQSAMPAAVFNYILAERYHRSSEEVASLVVISTLVSSAFLPFLLPFLL